MEYELYNPEEMAKRYSNLTMGADIWGCYDPSGGVLMADKCLKSVWVSQCSAKRLNWKKIELKREIHGWDRMIMLNTGTALKYSNLGEVTTFLGKIGLKNHIFAILPLLLAF